MDYRDAAHRHYEDALLLEEGNRTANADHLLGLSAECALKAVMQGLGMELDHGEVTKPKERQHKVHINELWSVFVTFAQSRDATVYAAWIDAFANPFADWHVSQRYDHRSGISPQALANVHAEMTAPRKMKGGKHKAGAQRARWVLRMAELDGVVP